MSTNITNPIIKKIKDNETALAEFEKETQSNEAEDTKDIIMNFPTVYIHNWPEQASMTYMSGNPTISSPVQDNIIKTK